MGPVAPDVGAFVAEVAFIAVRTNRNRNKITSEEQDMLAAKCVGIAGLSVGGALAMTLVMERTWQVEIGGRRA